MPPRGGREDPFVLKYLLTITAAAVAETGEVYSGIKSPEYIACLHCLDSLLFFLLLTHPFITPLDHSAPTPQSGPQTYPLQVSSLASQAYPYSYFLCLIVSLPPTSPCDSLVLHPIPYVKSLNHYFPSLLYALLFSSLPTFCFSNLPPRHHQNSPPDPGSVCERKTTLQRNAQDSFWNW